MDLRSIPYWSSRNPDHDLINILWISECYRLADKKLIKNYTGIIDSNMIAGKPLNYELQWASPSFTLWCNGITFLFGVQCIRVPGCLSLKQSISQFQYTFKRFPNHGWKVQQSSCDGSDPKSLATEPSKWGHTVTYQWRYRTCFNNQLITNGFKIIPIHHPCWTVHICCCDTFRKFSPFLIFQYPK